MDPLRTAGLWLGVGAGHAAVLIAVWGESGTRHSVSGDDNLLMLAWVADAPRTDAPPAVIPPSPAASTGTTPARVTPPAPVATVPAEAGRAGTSPVGAAPGATQGEPPRFLDRVEPVYPRAARLAGAEGVVRLRLAIAADGSVRRIAVLAGSGEDALDRAAEAAARASTYVPARIGGRSVDAEVEASYRFELR